MDTNTARDTSAQSGQVERGLPPAHPRTRACARAQPEATRPTWLRRNLGSICGRARRAAVVACAQGSSRCTCAGCSAGRTRPPFEGLKEGEGAGGLRCAWPPERAGRMAHAVGPHARTPTPRTAVNRLDCGFLMPFLCAFLFWLLRGRGGGRGGRGRGPGGLEPPSAASTGQLWPSRRARAQRSTAAHSLRRVVLAVDGVGEGGWWRSEERAASTGQGQCGG